MKIRRRHYIYACVFVFCSFVALRLSAETKPGHFYEEAPFLGSILVTIGWVLTSEVNIGNSKRQHTITLLTQHSFDPNRAKNRDIIRKYLPSYSTRLTPAIVDFDDEANDLLKAIDLELNFYEFMANGAARDDLDERLIRLNLESQFRAFIDQTEPYIAHWQAKSPSTWRGLTTLHAAWTRPKIRIFGTDFFRRLGARF